MTPMIVQESRVQAIGRLVICVAFVGVCLWTLSRPAASNLQPAEATKAVIFLRIGMAFFGLLALRYLWAACFPGTLTIDAQGITQNLGWRRLHWAWNDIDHTEVIRTAAGLVSACLIYPRVGGRVRLFGWEVPADQLERKIEEYRSA